MHKINGWININKPLNFSSAKTVYHVKKILNLKKVGHAGTLDPLATGVLPICINEATKTVSFVMSDEKEYMFEITFGEERDTHDAEGEIINTSNKIPTKEEILKSLPQFIGEIEQVPPIYSAIKIKGKRACDLVRKNQEVKLQARKINIFNLKFLNFTNKNTARFSVKCGKGTYVRSLARDLSKVLGTYGYISKLERTRVGIFNQDNIISLEKLKELDNLDKLKGYLITIGEVLSDMPRIDVDSSIADKLRNGVPCKCKSSNKNIVSIFHNDIVCFAKIEDNIMKPIKVFNL